MSTVGVVGLGLIGGSLAQELAAAGWSVRGEDRDPDTEADARAAGIEVGDVDPDEVDLLVLAVPVRAAPARLRELARRIRPGDEVVVTDVGSTKRSIAAAAGRAGIGARFVGGHPLAGDHRSGWRAARRGLFGGAPVWLCADDAVPADRVDRVAAMWRAVRAVPRRIGAADHDRLLARSSHLPQLAATALAAALGRADVDPGDVGPGGRDTTRLAGSDPDLWTDILVDNADEVVPAVDELIGVLVGLRGTVEARDADALRRWLEAGRRWRNGADG